MPAQLEKRSSQAERAQLANDMKSSVGFNKVASGTPVLKVALVYSNAEMNSTTVVTTEYRASADGSDGA